MPIKITHGGKTAVVNETENTTGPGREPGKNIHLANGMIVNTKEFEAFGRFRMSNKLIAMFYETNTTAVTNMLRRTDLRDAYNRGRAMTAMALRQKAVQQALAGDSSVLKWVMEMFGDMDELRDATTVEAESQTRRSWNAEIAAAAEKVAQKYVQ